MPVSAAVTPQANPEFLPAFNCSHLWLSVCLNNLVLVDFLLTFICIYLGADVGHPGPGIAKPSVTGLVFSYDDRATRYAALTDIQQPRVEVIESLQKMMERALGKFIEFCKILPRRVILFRDGVSEGEYNTVATAELEAIQGKSRLIYICA